MKFYEQHRKDLLDSFLYQGMCKDDFHFIKRKGRIITHHIQTKFEFSYFLKKDLVLNDEMALFEENTYFEICCNKGQRYKVNEWADVLHQMNIWLQKIKNYYDMS